MINTQRLIKCMFCGNPMHYTESTLVNQITASVYSCKRYNTGTIHGEQQLFINNNEIIQYNLEFKIDNKKYWVKSSKDKNTEFYTYETQKNWGGSLFMYNSLKCISTVPKFFPLDINDWITDFFNLKTKFSKLILFT
jgi:hypothetical protein